MKHLRRTARKWGVLGGLAGGLAGAGLHLVTGCMPNRPEPKDVTAYASEQENCVAEHDTRASIDACRAESRGKWCARWPGEVNCADGGPK